MNMKAYDTYKLLCGAVCVYKPAKPSFGYVVHNLKQKICKELNEVGRSPRPYLEIDNTSSELSINVRPSYADNVLCSGPRFRKKHFEMSVLHPLSDLASGVLVMCINDGQNLSELLKRLSFTRCYHLKGVLGQMTSNFHIDNKVVAKGKYDNVDRYKFEKIIANYQAATQRRIYEEYGFSLQSEEAYKFALKGLYRPAFKGAPIIYSIKVVDFKPPDFTIEVQCIFETEVHLMHLINNLGLRLKCYATCAGIRCLRYGPFHVEHALAKSQWTVDNLIENINICWDILEKSYPKEIKFSSTVATIKRPKTGLLESITNEIKG